MLAPVTETAVQVSGVKPTMNIIVAARKLSLFIPLVSFIFPLSSLAGTFTVYGPKTVTRTTGAPSVTIISFAAPAVRNDYFLKLETDQVSSASISINGVKIIDESSFNQQISEIFRSISLNESNDISVELSGKPDSALKVTILGLDNTPPTISYTLDPQPNSAEWNKENVTVSFECSDDFSGIASCTDPITIDTEGSNISVTGTAIDFAGNQTNTSVEINLDKTSPVINAIIPAITNEPQIAIQGSVVEVNPVVQFLINGSNAVLTGSDFSQPVILSEGQNSIEISAVDIAENTGYFEQQIVLDTIPPLTPIKSLVILTNIENGSVKVIGQESSVEGSSIVSITNVSNNVTQTIQSQSNGEFSIPIAASPGDSLLITATDAATNTSSPLEIQIPNGSGLPIQIDSPQQNDVLNKDVITVTGTFTAPVGSGVTVNGNSAAIIGDQFIANDVRLKPGENTISALITSLDGATGESQIVITYDNSVTPNIYLVAKHDSGIGQVRAEFFFVPLNGVSPRRVSADYNNDGNYEETRDYSRDSPRRRVFGVGVHTINFRILDWGNNYYFLTHTVVVEDLIQLDILLKDNFSAMKSRLIDGNINDALPYFASYRRDSFSQLFTQLGNQLSARASNFGSLTLDKIRGNFAQYILLKDTQGQTVGSPVFFIRNKDGVWRIEDM